MVDPSAFHSITVSMHEGMLTLATFSILMRVLFGKRSVRIRKYTEPTAYLAALGGIIGMIMSSITGYILQSPNALVSSPSLMNKVMITIFALELWVVFLIVGTRYGGRLWENSRLMILSFSLGTLGYMLIVLSGSIGGHLAVGGSVLDPFYHLLGIKPDDLWVAQPFFALSNFLIRSGLTISMSSLLQIAVIVDGISILLLILYLRRLIKSQR